MFIESYTQDELCRNYCSLTSKLVTQTSAGQQCSKQGHPLKLPFSAWSLAHPALLCVPRTRDIAPEYWAFTLSQGLRNEGIRREGLQEAPLLWAKELWGEDKRPSQPLLFA